MAAIRMNETGRKLVWFVGLWAAGILATAALAYAIRLLFQI